MNTNYSALVEYLQENPPQVKGDYDLIAKKFNFTSEKVRYWCRQIGCTINHNSQGGGNIMVKKILNVSDYVDEVLQKLSVKNVQPVKLARVRRIKQGEGDEEKVVQILSDWQLGHKTISFNYKVAVERVQKLLNATVKIVNLHRQAYPLKEINLFLLGDFIQSEKVGWLVDLSELESILIDQIYEQAVPLLSSYIQELSKHFAKINVYCTRGNHGRGEKGSSEKTNWDDVIYHTLKIKFSENKRVKINIAKEFYQVVDILGWKFLLTHGDQVRGGSYGIPLYALLQRMLRWATAMPFHWDFLAVGHWHNFAYLEQNGQSLIVNGTLVSDDEYVRKSYGWNASTSQTLCSVHPKQGITWLYKLRLNDRVKQ